MKRIPAVLSLVVLLAGTAALSAPASAAGPGALTIPHAISPAVAAYGTTVVAVVQRVEDGALMAYQESDGSWGSPTVLTPDAATTGIGSAQLVLAPNGVGAAVWLRTVDDHSAAMVRLHLADGTWGSPERVPGVWDVQGLAVNQQGDVVVAAATENGVTMLAHVHGAWHSVPVPGYVYDTEVGIDDRGVVHLASHYEDHGGEGSITVRRWSVKGGWTKADTVTRSYEMVPGMSFAVQPDGTEYVAVGTVSDRWMSTWDTDAYWPTAYYVLRRARHASSWTRVWSRAGAEQLQMVADATNVRLLWQQLADPDPKQRPQRLSLLTQMLGPDNPADDGAPHRLATTTGKGGQMERTDFEAALAPSAGARPGIAWRIRGPVNDPGSLGLWDYDGNQHLHTTFTGPRDYSLEAALAPLPGWVAYASEVTLPRSYGGQVDGTVQVVPVS